MKLIDESNRNNRNSNKILTIGIVGIISLIAIIVILLIIAIKLGGNSVSLTVDGTKYKAGDHLLDKDGTLYIGIEDFTKITKNEYNYKSGGKDVEDNNQCYVTNYGESTFFTVGSNKIYKESKEDKSIEYYNLEKPVIKENGKIYISLNDIDVAMNSRITKDNNKYVISSIGYLESYYNRSESKTFVPDSTVVWDTSYKNKKMLKLGLVITKDSEGYLGISKISTSSNKKTKVTKVNTTAVINPKYSNIEYEEKFNQLTVVRGDKKGIIQLSSDDNGNFSAKTVVDVQYEDIGQINEKFFWVSEKISTDTIKYGIIDISSGKEEVVLPTEYDAIGIADENFKNNGIENKYLIYNELIPVCKDDLWGFVNLSGNVVIKIGYTGLGYVGTNPNTSVLLIPEKEAIVVQKNKNYGIITKTNRVLVRNITSRVYRENIDGEIQYSMIINDEKKNVLDYINGVDKKEVVPDEDDNTETGNVSTEGSESVDVTTTENESITTEVTVD